MTSTGGRTPSWASRSRSRSRLLPAVVGRRDGAALGVATYLRAASVLLSPVRSLRWPFVVGTSENCFPLRPTNRMRCTSMIRPQHTASRQEVGP